MGQGSTGAEQQVRNKTGCYAVCTAVATRQSMPVRRPPCWVMSLGYESWQLNIEIIVFLDLQAAATTTSPPLLQCHPDVWAQVLLPKLVAQGSAGSVALTCSRLRDVCYSSVQQLNVVVVHESMLAYTFRTVRSWGLSLQAHFPGCTSISVGLGCAFDCGFVIQLIPGLAR